MALENRLDLRVANGAVYDAQRQVVVAADALRARFDRGSRPGTSGNNDDGTASFQGTEYAALLSLDLPIDEDQDRGTQHLSHQPDQSGTGHAERSGLLRIRSSWRFAASCGRSWSRGRASRFRPSRSSWPRSGSAAPHLFLEAGRAEIRDLLEAQDSLLSAQNSLTAAVVNYRTAELQFQRDLDLLTITKEGLWEEFSPEDIKHDSQQQQS